jgi:hypothetical protein
MAGLAGVPKNGVSRSKHLLKPQPESRHYWGLELRTSLIIIQISKSLWLQRKVFGYK